MKPPRRILIIRLSAMGDIIMASGLIPALRSLWPDAHIGWLAEEAHAGLLQDHPRLDRLHRLPRGRWRQLRQSGRIRELAGDIGAFVRALRAERYDLALDLQGLLKSGVWARLSGAGQRIGLGSREGSQWLMTQVIPRAMDDPRIGKEYRDLAVRLGAVANSFAMDIPVPEAARQRARALLAEAGVRGDYAVLAPFTTRPQKHWFDERWAALANRLEPRLTPVVLGGPGDQARAEDLLAMTGGRAVSLAGATSLPDCAALIEPAALLIGVDTGLTHLGLALRTPTVALFGSTAPYLDTTRENGLVLYVPRDCSPCHRRPSCGGQFDCMRAHTVESVLAGVARLPPSSPDRPLSH